MCSTHVLLMLGLVVTIPASVAGQTSDRSKAVAGRFEELKGRLEPDQRLVVTTTDGKQVRGRFENVDASSLVLRAGGEVRELREIDVREVRRRGDRLWNGALVGAGVGGLGGALVGGGRPGCSGDEAFCSGLGFLAGVSIGALVGLTVDALMPHDDLLFAHPQAQSRQWKLVPLFGARGYGVRVVKAF